MAPSKPAIKPNQSTSVKMPKLMLRILMILSVLALSGWLGAAFSLALGILLGWFNSVGYHKVTNAQLAKWASLILKVAIVLLGFTLPLSELALTAKNSFWLTFGFISLTLILGFFLSKLFKINLEQSWLISSGTAICGGSAIAAVGSSIKASQDNMIISLAIVFILNAVALFIFPQIGHWFELSQHQFGLWAATAIHDTSSVVGAAALYGQEALEIATTTKLSRALWIIPLALLASFIHNRASDSSERSGKISIPLFIVFFIVASFIGSFMAETLEVSQWTSTIKTIAKNLFALSLLWMGASLSQTSLKTISLNAMVVGLILWILVSTSSLAIIYYYY